MAVFVVHGYTVLAMSLAPISGNRTLALGSADGKQTVCAHPDAVDHALGVAKLLGCAADRTQWPERSASRRRGNVCNSWLHSGCPVDFAACDLTPSKVRMGVRCERPSAAMWSYIAAQACRRRRRRRRRTAPSAFSESSRILRWAHWLLLRRPRAAAAARSSRGGGGG